MSLSFRNFSDSWNKLSNKQKRKETALPYTLYVNRPLGRFLAVLGHSLHLRPDFVSILSFLITLSGLVFLLLGGFQEVFTAFISVIFLLFGYGLDSADGQLARLTGLKSPAGEWLDHALDSIKIPLFHVTVVLVLLQVHELSNTELFLFLCIGIFASARFFSTELKEKILSSKGKENPGLGLLRDIILAPFDYGVLCFIFLLTPAGYLFLGYTLWGVAFVAFAILSFIRSYLQLRKF